MMGRITRPPPSYYTGKGSALKRGGGKKGAKRVAMIVLAYLLLGVPVTVRASIGISNLEGAAQVSLGALGVALQRDAMLRWGPGIRPGLRARYENSPKRKTGGGMDMARLLHLARTALRAARVQRFQIGVRLGLLEAQQTAVAAGAVRALLSSVLAASREVQTCEVAVVPDFASPGLLLTARCIFSFTPGDIMFAALGAAVSKLRKEGFTWHSIPSKT